MLSDKIVDVLQILSNTIKQHQTRWPNGKMFGSLTMFDVVMFGRRTFPVLTGPKPASRSANLYLNPVYRHLKNAERRPSFCQQGHTAMLPIIYHRLDSGHLDNGIHN